MTAEMRLRDVRDDDLGAYIRMRCDPVMMADLGGPQQPDRMPGQLRRDVEHARDDTAWIKMIVVGETVAGTVTLFAHEGVSEIGWMVLPDFQGRGLAGSAVRAILALARADGRWGPIHAFPAVTNAASNAVCRSAGFRFAGEEDTPFAGNVFRTNHWISEPGHAERLR